MTYENYDFGAEETSAGFVSQDEGHDEDVDTDGMVVA